MRYGLPEVPARRRLCRRRGGGHQDRCAERRDAVLLFEDGTLTDAPAEVIARCIRYKAGVVERDEKEQGERRKLNLGHTVGHAIEKCSGYAIPHGHAVAAGLAVMARASERLGWAEPGVSARIAACLEKNGLPTGTDYPAEALAKAALADKKRSGDSITIVVPRAIGDCELKRIPVTELLPIIAAGLGDEDGCSYPTARPRGRGHAAAEQVDGAPPAVGRRARGRREHGQECRALAGHRGDAALHGGARRKLGADR